MPNLARLSTQLLLAAVFLSPLPSATLHAQAATDATAPQMEFVFEEVVTLGAPIHPGETPYGERNIIPITGGTVSGPHIKGTILPGGWDWQLATKPGCHRLQADYMIKTDDGVVINVLNKAAMCQTASFKPGRTLTTPVFEAPLGRYDWLNDGAYIGTLEGATVEGKPAVRIRFYKAR